MSIIEVNHVTKEYRLGQMKSLKQSVLGAFGRLCGRAVPKQEPFKALDDIDFKVEEGEVLGIIGPNGAGKSTLLKLLARVSVPTKGGIEVRGSVAPLIEVGAGLHPELTGRENIFLNGSIMGLPRAVIKEKFDEIVEFAELEEFIDTPIKRYSSGMMIRLGFSIATSADADILIIDEVLAVGDLAFQRKCFDRMEELIKRSGKTVLLVSHNIRQVQRMCTRTLLLNTGKIIADGDSEKVCNEFYDISNKKILNYKITKRNDPRSVMSSGEIDLNYVLLFQGTSSDPTDEVEMHEPIRIGIHFTVNTDMAPPEIVVGFHTTDFVYIAATSTSMLSRHPNVVKGANYIECKLDDMPLKPAVYGIRVAILDQYSRPIWYGENLKNFKVNGNRVDINKMPVLSMVDLNFEWDFSPKHRPHLNKKAVDY